MHKWELYCNTQVHSGADLIVMAMILVMTKRIDGSYSRCIHKLFC